MAIDFDGNDAIDCGRIAATESIAKISIAMWIQLDSYVNWGFYGAKQLSNNERYSINQWANQAKWSVNVAAGLGSNSYGYTINNVLDTTNWHHIGFSYDGGGATDSDKLKLYHNGVGQAVTYSGSLPATTSSTTNAFVFGAQFGAGQLGMDGRLDDLAIWTTNLTADDFATLAKAKVKGLPRKIQPVSLEAYWPCDEDPHGTTVPATAGYVRDLSGNGNDGTRAGDPDYYEGILSYPGWPVYADAPAAAGDVTVTPSALALTGAQQMPTVTYDFLVSIAAELGIAATPQAPTTVAGMLVQIGQALSLTTTAQGPTVFIDCTALPSALALGLAQQSPTVLADLVYTASALGLTTAINDPTVVLPSAGQPLRVLLIEDDLHI